jgi:hypothetical protein
MAETSMLWTTNGTGHGVASGYASNRWQALLKKLFLSDQAATACVLNGVDSDLAVSGTASPISVAAGAAIDYAFFYENDAPLALTIATPTVGLTGGHVVLEANWAAQTVTAKAIRNTDGLSAIPALTQTANTTWQVRLATFTITTGGVVALTDARKRVKFSNHVYANGFDSSAVDNSTVELAGGALRLKDAGVTAAKLAAAIAGNGLAGGAGTALSVNVDNTTIEINADTLRVKDGGIDDLKVGNRVAQFYRRQGGNASDWSIGGTTNYIPANVRILGGTLRFVGPIVISGSSLLTLTYPVAFSNKPLFFAFYVGTQNGIDAEAQNPTASTIELIARNDTGSAQSNVDIQWFAIGPE